MHPKIGELGSFRHLADRLPRHYLHSNAEVWLKPIQGTGLCLKIGELGSFRYLALDSPLSSGALNECIVLGAAVSPYQPDASTRGDHRGPSLARRVGRGPVRNASAMRSRTDLVGFVWRPGAGVVLALRLQMHDPKQTMSHLPYRQIVSMNKTMADRSGANEIDMTERGRGRRWPTRPVWIDWESTGVVVHRLRREIAVRGRTWVFRHWSRRRNCGCYWWNSLLWDGFLAR
jgi:hypothetical protein